MPKKPVPFHLSNIREPFALTIFGASGDLAKLKIFPSLYEMAKQKRLPKQYWIHGYARTKMTKKAFHSIVRTSIIASHGKDADDKVIRSLLKHIDYFSGQYSEETDFIAYRKHVAACCGRTKPYPHIAYFSTPPVVFQDIVRNLATTRKSKKEDIRLVIEKPFGTSRKSAEKLFHFVSEYFEEDQFYLLDHYLGKSAVQSILNMRQSNRLLTNIIKGTEVANIQITAFEETGVSNRIDYFDSVGITRDIIQSHLLQILALVTMDIPKHHNAESLQREKNNIIEAIECPKAKHNIVVGQYASYKKQKGVPSSSRTDTFAALRLFLDRQDWHNTPIYIRTGKKLHEKHTYVVIELKKFPFQQEKDEPNRIIVEFYPEPKISISLINFQEGIDQYQSISSSASIACNINGCLPAHADLLLDVLNKDRMHFLSFAEILSSWKVVDKIINHMKRKRVPLYRYADGSTGPTQQEQLTKQDGFVWYDHHLLS